MGMVALDNIDAVLNGRPAPSLAELGHDGQASANRQSRHTAELANGLVSTG